MNLRCLTLFLLPALIRPDLAIAQRALIQNTTPERVTEALKNRLLPQGFQFVNGGAKQLVMTLDRGMVRQANSFDCKTHVNLLHVVMELRFRYKQKTSGLEVSAFEQVIASDSCGEQSRRPVSPGVELEHLQQLLDQVRGELEGSPSSSDSAGKADSTH